MASCVGGKWKGDSLHYTLSPVLNAELASWYASLVGMLRWMVEIGQVDNITEVSMVASHMAMPREGHLDAVLHIFWLSQDQVQLKDVL